MSPNALNMRSDSALLPSTEAVITQNYALWVAN